MVAAYVHVSLMKDSNLSIFISRKAMFLRSKAGFVTRWQHTRLSTETHTTFVVQSPLHRLWLTRPTLLLSPDSQWQVLSKQSLTLTALSLEQQILGISWWKLALKNFPRKKWCWNPTFTLLVQKLTQDPQCSCSANHLLQRLSLRVRQHFSREGTPSTGFSLLLPYWLIPFAITLFTNWFLGSSYYVTGWKCTFADS